MNKYEIMYIIRPNIEDEAKKALVERFNTILLENGAETAETKDWGKRRLAYEINDFRDGYYEITKTTSSVSRSTRIFSSCKNQRRYHSPLSN